MMLTFYTIPSNHFFIDFSFGRVASSSNIPIILYNVPIFTGVDMSVNAVSRIAPHPNVIGIKVRKIDFVSNSERKVRV